MKYLFFKILFISFIFSCGNDDDGIDDSPLEDKISKIESYIDGNFNSKDSFIYYNNGQLKELINTNHTGNITKRNFFYTDNVLKTIEIDDGTLINRNEFEYNNQNQLTKSYYYSNFNSDVNGLNSITEYEYYQNGKIYRSSKYEVVTETYKELYQYTWNGENITKEENYFGDWENKLSEYMFEYDEQNNPLKGLHAQTILLKENKNNYIKVEWIESNPSSLCESPDYLYYTYNTNDYPLEQSAECSTWSRKYFYY